MPIFRILFRLTIGDIRYALWTCGVEIGTAAGNNVPGLVSQPREHNIGRSQSVRT